MTNTAMYGVGLITLLWATGCSDDSTSKAVCRNEDRSSCTTKMSSCTSTCVADEACLKKCQVTYCDCLFVAKCDPPDECKINTDGGTIKDGAPLDGNESCDSTDVTACTTDQSTCVMDCADDAACVQICKTEYCDCLTEAECTIPADCKKSS
jgi:hypothetical protein